MTGPCVRAMRQHTLRKVYEERDRFGFDTSGRLSDERCSVDNRTCSDRVLHTAQDGVPLLKKLCNKKRIHFPHESSMLIFGRLNVGEILYSERRPVAIWTIIVTTLARTGRIYHTAFSACLENIMAAPLRPPLIPDTTNTWLFITAKWTEYHCRPALNLTKARLLVIIVNHTFYISTSVIYAYVPQYQLSRAIRRSGRALP